MKDFNLSGYLKNNLLLTEADLGKASDNLSVGDKLVKRDQTLTIKKIVGDNVWLESDLTPGRVAQWPKDEVESQISSGKAKWQPAMSERFSLKESIGGYVDIKPVKFLKEDDEFDEWCQANPEDCKRYKQSQEDADKAFTDEFGSYSSDETNEANDNSITSDPRWEYDDDDEGDIDYADYGLDPNTTPESDPDGRAVVDFIQTMRDFEKKGDPSLSDNFKNWWKEVKSNYKFGKKAYDAGFRMNEDGEEGEKYAPLKSGEDFKYSDEYLKDLEARKNGTYKYSDADYERTPEDEYAISGIGRSFWKEAKETDTKEKPKAKGKLKEGKIRPSSSEFTWDI